MIDTAFPTRADWPSPANATICDATSTRPVAVNVIGLPASPVPFTVTAFAPTRVPSRQPPTLATPAESDTGAEFVMLPPPAATAALTVLPATGLPNWSTILTCGAMGTIVFTIADCKSPMILTMVVADPASPVAVNTTGVGGFFNVLNFGQMLLWHALLLPAALGILVVLHVLLVRLRGVVEPIPLPGRDEGAEEEPR